MQHANTPGPSFFSLHPTLRRPLRRIVKTLVALAILFLIIMGIGRLWLRHTMHKALPPLDGQMQLSGLQNKVQVERDAHGVPHIIATSVDDMLVAQGYVTAQDRLWQMDMLRRHAAGELAEILGSKLVEHDRLQRYLQLRATADDAIQRMDPEQKHQLEMYAKGVNAFIATHSGALPVEFHLLGYEPAPWTARDSVLVGYAMSQDLSTSFQDKLNREAVVAHLSPEQQSDLYPIGSWRDHPPAGGNPDLKEPTPFLEIPLDASQSSVRTPEHVEDLHRVTTTLADYVSQYRCDGCMAGSNNWVVSGAHTASGHPLLANDPHLALNLPDIWYTADLESGSFHATGVTLPGLPFIMIGHNQHIAWGFTNSEADVQDVYIETVQRDQYRGQDGAWHPLAYRDETIRVHHGLNEHLHIAFTQHGGVRTPIISPLYPKETRSLALRWSIYDTADNDIPFGKVDAATNWLEFLSAFERFQGPAQNAVYADDQGHIGYHLVGRIPVRGDAQNPSGLSPVPVATGTYEWSSYLPFSELPLVYDPPGGVLATANARITADDYAHSISLDWASPYRNERIWKVLNNSSHLTPGDMQTLQLDVLSEFDQTLGQRIAYAVDHAHTPSKKARQAADLLRGWNGEATTDAPEPNLVAATVDALWPMLLQPHLGDAASLYTWRERSYVLENLVANAPARWLPAQYTNWNDLLTAALEKGMEQKHAPSNLATWKWGETNRVHLQHPIFAASRILRLFAGAPIGTGSQAIPGTVNTVRVGRKDHGASMRFVDDPMDPDHASMILVTGESGNPASGWYLDQFPLWLNGKTLTLPFTSHEQAPHTLTLTP